MPQPGQLWIYMQEIFYECMAAWGRSLTFQRIKSLGDFFGKILFFVLKKRREMSVRMVMKHLEMDRKEAVCLVEKNYKHIVRSFLSVFISHKIDFRTFCEYAVFDNPHFLEELHNNSDRPVMIATGHIGCWELGASLVRFIRPCKKITIVARRSKNVALNRFIKDRRTSGGVSVIDHRQAVREVLRCFKKKETVCFLVDHNCIRSEAVFLPFLKDIAAVNAGPALLALRAEAIVQPMFVVFEGEKFRIYTEPALDTRKLAGTREEKIQQVALYYTRAVEKMIHKHPDQWYWIHKRWKTRPSKGWKYTPFVREKEN